MNFSAIVLAAGTSSRMGPQNKLLLPVGGQPMVRVVVENILTAGLADVIVVTGHEEAAVRSALASVGADLCVCPPQASIRFVHNPQYAQGMTSSIQAGVSAATGDGYLIALADMPLFKSDDYATLVTAFEEAYKADPLCIIAASCNGKQRNPVIFSNHYREAILNHPFPEGCKEILLQNAAHVRLIDFPESIVLKDFDTPEAYHGSQI